MNFFFFRFDIPILTYLNFEDRDESLQNAANCSVLGVFVRELWAVEIH